MKGIGEIGAWAATPSPREPIGSLFPARFGLDLGQLGGRPGCGSNPPVAQASSLACGWCYCQTSKATPTPGVTLEPSPVQNPSRLGPRGPVRVTGGNIVWVGGQQERNAGCLGAEGRLARQLLRDLFADYTSALRPVADMDHTLNVTLEVTLSQIIDMDERDQVLTLYLWIRQEWGDAHLRWALEDYGDIDSIRIPSSLVWRPDIVLYNKADTKESGPADTNVVLGHDGQVRWDAPAITRSSCRVDVALFPFNRQCCRLTFGSWTHGGHQVDMRARGALARLDDFVEKVEWCVLSMAAHRSVVTYFCCSEPYPDVTYTLRLQRRAAFYVSNLLLPCVLISLLAPLAFLLPAASGEKVSLGITVLLALTVFQLLVAETMPPAESMTLIGKYYIVTMTMVTTSTALTIFIMNLHYCGPGARPVPAWARALILHHLAWLLCVCVPEGGPKETRSARDPERVEAGGQGSYGQPRCPCHQVGLRRDVADIARCFRSQHVARRRGGEWQWVARVVDRFFMWVFSAMVLAMSLLVLGQGLRLQGGSWAMGSPSPQPFLWPCHPTIANRKDPSQLEKELGNHTPDPLEDGMEKAESLLRNVEHLPPPHRISTCPSRPCSWPPRASSKISVPSHANNNPCLCECLRK
ncbi:neuronal acetylcholine receptor subunit alpha-10 [Tachyglossus aculeatus]|uniref:neuronal acetylcholine receptor subunit alpha-10 n=1 Tax=Tachyglossus aculeatus TaxID=9261 RepID=UPI0018F4DB91|nr:neuronal acetylcholine receptor subunit alpha-10 [Tachyglossus aculeatus]